MVSVGVPIFAKSNDVKDILIIDVFDFFSVL